MKKNIFDLTLKIKLTCEIEIIFIEILSLRGLFFLMFYYHVIILKIILNHIHTIIIAKTFKYKFKKYIYRHILYSNSINSTSLEIKKK